MKVHEGQGQAPCQQQKENGEGPWSGRASGAQGSWGFALGQLFYTCSRVAASCHTAGHMYAAVLRGSFVLRLPVASGVLALHQIACGSGTLTVPRNLRVASSPRAAQ